MDVCVASRWLPVTTGCGSSARLSATHPEFAFGATTVTPKAALLLMALFQAGGNERRLITCWVLGLS